MFFYFFQNESQRNNHGPYKDYDYERVDAPIYQILPTAAPHK